MLISDDFHNKYCLRPGHFAPNKWSWTKASSPTCNVTSNITCNRDSSSTVTVNPAWFIQPCKTPSTHFITSLYWSTEGLQYTSLTGAETTRFTQTAQTHPLHKPYTKSLAWEAPPGPPLWVRGSQCMGQPNHTTLKIIISLDKNVSCLNPQARVKDNDWFNQETIKSPDILKRSSTPSIGQELRTCLIIIIMH